MAGFCGSTARAIIECPLELAKIRRQTGQSYEFKGIYKVKLQVVRNAIHVSTVLGRKTKRKLKTQITVNLTRALTLLTVTLSLTLIRIYVFSPFYIFRQVTVSYYFFPVHRKRSYVAPILV